MSRRKIVNNKKTKVYIYTRVSTVMQIDGYSLEAQKNKMKNYAEFNDFKIAGEYEDAGKSGKSIEGRMGFNQMIEDIKSGKLLISVLSAVAEIERENIIEQTMNGRREKARQGGWNGGFAPYGYYLKDNQLLIEETEAEAIRIIFDKFANSDIVLGGVAKYLNLQGIKKIPRQNGTLETWSSHFIRLILDNPVYCGKIAYGRRTREKVKGTKNEYKQVHAEDYILEDGQHEGIISEKLWQKVHAKRMATGIKQPSKIGKDRSHLLTGILKCPLCGSLMYTNKHAWTNKDGTYKEVYYYICGRNKQERGHHCDYKASLRKTDIEPLVIEAIKELVSDKYFAKEIEKRIGVQTDTTAIDKELANYESKLKEVDLNKARLEREIDNLPIDARFRERKIHDMTLRLDALYDTIVELEERIEDAKLRKSSIEMETITLDNIYKLMLNFGKLYDIISDEEKKSLITYLIKEIQIYPNGESEQPLKSIEFNFPIYRDGQEVRRLLWEKGNTVETVVKLSLKKDTPKIEVTMEPEEESNYTPEEKATYPKIKEYVKNKYGVNVHTSYIAQVKRMCGLDMVENYNKSKKENPEVKQCPQEKVEYIKDALRYFNEI
nr:recombinase family protein [Eubacterium sp. LMAG:50]